MKTIKTTANLVALETLNSVIASLTMSTDCVYCHDALITRAFSRNATKSHQTVTYESETDPKYSESPNTLHVFSDTRHTLVISAERQFAESATGSGAFAHIDVYDCDYYFYVIEFPTAFVQRIIDSAHNLNAIDRKFCDALTARATVFVTFPVRAAETFARRDGKMVPLFRRGDCVETKWGESRFVNAPIQCADGDLSPAEAAEQYFSDPKYAFNLYETFIYDPVEREFAQSTLRELVERYGNMMIAQYRRSPDNEQRELYRVVREWMHDDVVGVDAHVRAELKRIICDDCSNFVLVDAPNSLRLPVDAEFDFSILAIEINRAMPQPEDCKC